MFLDCGFQSKDLFDIHDLIIQDLNLTLLGVNDLIVGVHLSLYLPLMLLRHPLNLIIKLLHPLIQPRLLLQAFLQHELGRLVLRLPQ